MKYVKILLLFLVVNINILFSTFNLDTGKELINLKKYYNNQDIIGKLIIENTNIEEIIVQSNNNEYYNNHNLYKKEDIKGNIFLDYRTNLNSYQINIYGHNSNIYDVPFNELKKYLDKDYYEKHKYIRIFDGYNTYKYLIFSVNIRDDNEHLKIIKSEKHLEKLKQSMYKTNVDVNINDKLLIIQTCYLDKNDSYIIICAKKI